MKRPSIPVLLARCTSLRRLAQTLLVLAPVLLLGCPSAWGTAPVSVPASLGALPADRCHALVVAVWNESRVPAYARNVAASCEDPAVCSVEVGKSLIIRGKGPGETNVKVAYDHPTSGQHEEKRIHVTFTPAPPADTLHPSLNDPSCVGVEAIDDAPPDAGAP